MTSTQDTLKSSYREILIEHLLVGEVMRRLWLRGICEFEVLQPQVDDSGYDLVFEANGIVRHVQLKASFRGSSTGSVKVSIKLLDKPSACVIWVQFAQDTMDLGPFLWFGGAPGEPLPDIRSFKVAKHTRANAEGKKQDRPNQRSIPRSEFKPLASYEDLMLHLFGQIEPRSG